MMWIICVEFTHVDPPGWVPGRPAYFENVGPRWGDWVVQDDKSRATTFASADDALKQAELLRGYFEYYGPSTWLENIAWRAPH